MSSQLNPRPHLEVGTSPACVDMLDQHKALLGPRAHEPNILADNVSATGNHGPHSTNQHQPFTGYDDDDVRALNGSGSVDSGEKNRPGTAVFWKGLPVYILSWDILSVLLSICFLGKAPCILLDIQDTEDWTVLGASVASLEGKVQSNWPRRVIQASRIAPSVWPIVFSGILGNAIRALADWRVERGLSLMVRAVSSCLLSRKQPLTCC